MAQHAPQTRSGPTGLGLIFATLAAASARPRYAFLVLQLVAEVADRQGKAGPLVKRGEGPMGLRDWLCTQLMPMSERNARRAALRARVIAGLADQLTGEVTHDERVISSAVDDQVLAVGRANVSRAISDLVNAGLLRRHYAGYATNHLNRGGGRHAVYVIEPAALLALGKATPQPAGTSCLRQGQLFAA